MQTAASGTRRREGRRWAKSSVAQDSSFSPSGLAASVTSHSTPTDPVCADHRWRSTEAVEGVTQTRTTFSGSPTSQYPITANAASVHVTSISIAVA